MSFLRRRDTPRVALPAALPLPGAAPGATLTLRPLLCGEIAMPPNWFERGRGCAETLKAFGLGVPASGLRRIPVPAYLLEHPTAGHVLVDTGLHGAIAGGRDHGHAGDRTGGRASNFGRGRNLGAVGAVMSRHTTMRPERTAAAQLRALGVDPAEIGLVVMTHLHFDHASALSDFPNATVLVEEREWRAAWARDRLLHGYATAQLDPRPQYRTLDFSSPPAAARGPFERTLDLFGDGSLMLASTPGHTAGHLSLIVRLAEREALLAVDAAYTMATIREGQRPWLTHNREAFEHSLRQVQAYDRENPGALIIPGHDMQVWQKLQPAY
jgi:N-acyl homoserine lactone hydrolase